MFNNCNVIDVPGVDSDLTCIEALAQVALKFDQIYCDWEAFTFYQGQYSEECQQFAP